MGNLGRLLIRINLYFHSWREFCGISFTGFLYFSSISGLFTFTGNTRPLTVFGSSRPSYLEIGHFAPVLQCQPLSSNFADESNLVDVSLNLSTSPNVWKRVTLLSTYRDLFNSVAISLSSSLAFAKWWFIVAAKMKGLDVKPSRSRFLFQRLMWPYSLYNH